MNILFFGYGPRADRLVDEYLSTGHDVTWVLSIEQSTDEGFEHILDTFGEDHDESLKFIKADETHALRRRTKFQAAHICIIPKFSPVTADPFNQPQLNSILELIEIVTMDNTDRLLVINSTLMAIGGNERALFGFSADFDYIYMPFLPIDFNGHRRVYLEKVKYPLFPTTPMEHTPIAEAPSRKKTANISIHSFPSILYQVTYLIRDMDYLERMAFHAFSAQLVFAQLANEIASVELMAGNGIESKAMVQSVTDITGIGEEVNPEILYNHQYISSIAMSYCSKPAYVFTSSAAVHANGVHVTQARIIMQNFNDTNKRHIAIYGGDYWTHNGIRASLEVAGLIAQEIGEYNVVIGVANVEQSLPEGWDAELVYNVMIDQAAGVEIPVTLIDGSTDIDLVI